MSLNGEAPRFSAKRCPVAKLDLPPSRIAYVNAYSLAEAMDSASSSSYSNLRDAEYWRSSAQATYRVTVELVKESDGEVARG